MWIHFAWVGVGGALGSMARYALTLVGQHCAWSSEWAILLANVLGSFLIGWAMGSLKGDAYLFAAMGFCGGFTTFSTFSSQAMRLFQSGQPMWGLAYMAASVLLSLLAVGFGLWMAAAIPFFGQQLPKP